MVKKCPVCGSKKWRKDGVTGNAVCEDGHVFQDFRSENLVAEATSHTLQKRTLRRGPRRNKRKDEGTANQDYYHGSEAEYLKIQAFQLLLRLQVDALSRLWNLPDAFELIVKDLWAYQLAISPLPAVPEPATRDPSPVPLDPLDDENEKGDDQTSGSESSGSSSDVPSDDEDILGENTNSDEGGDLREVNVQGDGKEDVRWKRKRRLRISDVVVTLVLGLWVLRIPVLYVDIESLINDNQIPYLDFGHTTLLSGEMRKHVNREGMLALCPARSPRPLFIFARTRAFARNLVQHFHINLPECNFLPISWRVISSVGGKPTTHSQAVRLLELLDVNLSLVETEIVKRKRRSRRTESTRGDASEFELYERTRRNNEVVMPELMVVSAWIIIMKMTYGLDGRDRCIIDKTDPAVGLPQLPVWLGELRERLNDESLAGGRSMLGKQSFQEMELDDMDRFLQQAEHVLLKDRDVASSETATFPLLSSSPLPPILPPPDSWAAYHIQASHSTISSSTIPLSINNREIPLMPGEKIRSYQADDITGTLPEEYEIILRAAATVVGVELEDVARVIEGFENKLHSMRRGRLRKSAIGILSRSHSRARRSMHDDAP